MIERTWQAVMDEMATHGIPTTQEGCARALRGKAYNAIRHKPLVETTGEDLLTIMHANGNCVGHYLRRLHNLALNLGWLAWPILAKAAWPKIRSQSKRGVTPEEHAKIIGSERNPERRVYYELLYETGAARPMPPIEAMRERKIVPMPLRVELTATEISQPARSYI